MNRLSPRNWPSLRRMASRASAAAWIREIVEFGAADPELPAAPARLACRDLQQQLVQARQRLLPLRTGAAERAHPVVGAGVEPGGREDRLDGGIGWRVMLTILRNQRPYAATAHKPQAVGKTSAPPGC